MARKWKLSRQLAPMIRWIISLRPHLHPQNLQPSSVLLGKMVSKAFFGSPIFQIADSSHYLTTLYAIWADQSALSETFLPRREAHYILPLGRWHWGLWQTRRAHHLGWCSKRQHYTWVPWTKWEYHWVLEGKTASSSLPLFDYSVYTRWARYFHSTSHSMSHSSHLCNELIAEIQAIYGGDWRNRQTQCNNWMTHFSGDLAIITSHPPSFFANGPAHRLFVDGRLNHVCSPCYAIGTQTLTCDRLCVRFEHERSSS